MNKHVSMNYYRVLRMRWIIILRLVDSEMEEIERLAIMNTMYEAFDDYGEVHYVHPLEDNYTITYPDTNVQVSVRPHFVVHYQYGGTPNLSYVQCQVLMEDADIFENYNVIHYMLLKVDVFNV